MKCSTGAYAAPRLSSLEPAMSLCYILVVILHLLSGVSYSVCRFFISGLKLALRLSDSDHIRDDPSATCDVGLPNRVEDMISFMGLEPKFRSFVCCPKCFYTYSVNSAYPQKCNNIEHPGDDECGRRLRANHRGNQLVPVREYIMQDFSDWLARLYNRPGMEEQLDHAVNRPSRSPQVLADVWDAPVMKDIRGSDKPFFNQVGRESRLAFSLNMDGFNPFTNKQAGKQVTTCGIYLVCLNLPPEFRYRPENVFLVGVVPGPSEPSLHQINYILKPLIDDFLILWKEGVYLMRTWKYASGRLVKAVIVPLVCDLPAARKMAGMGSHMFRFFCSECMLHIHEIDDLDFENWEPRSCERHQNSALQWRDASSRNEQHSLFQESGIRWSELLRLPYWDPTKFVLIDTMHCFYLGLFRRHVNDIWGMNVKTPDGEGPSFRLKGKEPTDAEMRVAWEIFNEGKPLGRLGYTVLIVLCRELGLRYAGTRAKLMKRLNEVRRHQIML